MPLFSVVLPTHDRAAMLRSALTSLLAQTCADWEAFVLDDGSTDGTPAVFEEFRGDARLKLFRFEDNRRQHARRNFALERAVGTFVAFLDSDDLWLPGRLEAFRRAIAERPGTDFWFSNAYLLRWGRIVGTVFDPRREVEEGAVPGWHAVGDRHLPYLTSNLAVRKACFDTVGRFREDLRILEDTELYARILARGHKVGALKRPLAVRRLHDEQITHDHAVDFREALEALKAGGAPAEALAEARRDLARAAALNLVKALKPAEARALLDAELGPGRGGACLRLLTRLPAPLLAAAKGARRAWLMLRRHPALAGPEEREAYRFIAPLLAREASAR